MLMSSYGLHACVRPMKRDDSDDEEKKSEPSEENVRLQR